LRRRACGIEPCPSLQATGSLAVLNQLPNPDRSACALDQNAKRKHDPLDPRGTPSGGRLQIGTMAGFKLERVAGFKSECMAGFVGIRIQGKLVKILHPLALLAKEPFGAN
jgi:hypothetical protein